MRGDVPKAENIAAGAQAEAVSLEKQQELLLMNKLASSGKLPPKSAGSFLQKRLQQRKFFDSGDYNMNKDKKGQPQPPPPPPVTSCGGATAIVQAPPPIAVPERSIPPPVEPKPKSPEVKKQELPELLPILRPPIGSFSGGSMDADEEMEEHLQIPRPDTVPQRKASILHPSAHSKLSPQPHIHHEHTDELLTQPPE